VRVHFLLGPAGSGKTWRCLEEIRRELKTAPAGPPLLLLAPKQATFQLERQLLADPDLQGYSRLQIVSFDRLARWLLDTFGTVPELLDDEGRVMVLRALLAREHAALRVFRATARLPGFARQLSQLLREFQRHQLTPARLARLAERCIESAPLRDKLHDLHHLLRAYHEWLAEKGLQDGDQLLDLATTFLRTSPSPISDFPAPIAGLWLDGFAEMTPQELDLLCAVLPFCHRATLAFCLDPQAADSQSWLSLWSTVRRTYADCRQRIAALPSCEVNVEELPRDPAHSRFRACPTLAQLEANWTAPSASSPSPPHLPSPISDSLRLSVCSNPESEATLAAREILRHVRAGGRFRDCAVLLRTLDHHHTALRRAFTRHGIPFFLDRREPVAHHPLAELTRFALRTLAYGWQPDDLFGALKSGLAHDLDADIDWLENLALAHGWRGKQWLEPLHVPDAKFNVARAEQLRARLTAPFQRLAAQLGAPVSDPARSLAASQPAGSETGAPQSAFSGSSLADALRSFWDDLAIESRLAAWDDALAAESDSPNLAPPLHATVLRQMHECLDNLERAFPADSPALPLREWLPILEAGLGALTVGVIPPALDQVLIGTIDRSRNPELQLALVLGLNEGIFPAPPAPPVLLTDTERDLLAAHDTRLGLDPRAQIAHERYFAYIACTRSRMRLVLICSAADTDGQPLHPSPILTHVQRVIPGLALEKVPPTPDWRDAEHAEELLEPLLRELATQSDQSPTAHPASSIQQLASLPTLAPVITRWREITAAHATTFLSTAAVHQLYGTELATSVSKLEQFAECPFKFFVAAGLGAEERKEFEVDHRERGSFIHRLLDEFHLRVAASGRRWRDLSPADAAALAARVGEDLLASPEFSLFAADESRRFAARSLVASAQRLLAALVGWMPSYAFDPVAVELGFGLPGSPLPAWKLDLAGGHALSLRGRIDRVDLCRDEKTGQTFAVVVDYKSSPKKLDPLKIAHGLQLQLLAYLNVLSQCEMRNAECGIAEDTTAPAGASVPFSASLQASAPDGGYKSPPPPHSAFRIPHSAFQPAGVFYVPLHGASGSTGERAETLSEDEDDRRATYQHAGRFDFAQRALLDARLGGAASGQFKLRLNRDGDLIARGSDALSTAEFTALLTQVEANLRRLGEAIFAGEISVSPVRLSASDKACDRCDYRAICRFDPWTQPYRALPKPAATEEEA
jgi:ATP-dependent helicase/nuclease subunit B